MLHFCIFGVDVDAIFRSMPQLAIKRVQTRGGFRNWSVAFILLGGAATLQLIVRDGIRGDGIRHESLSFRDN
jgi:hypothetical protein